MLHCPRSIVVLLLLEVFLSCVIANVPKRPSKPGNKKTQTAPSQCKLITIDNGESKPFAQGDLVRYTCKRNHRMYGVNTATCNEIDGQWSRAPPFCAVPACPDIPSSKDGRLQVELKDPRKRFILSFSCSSGFELHGPSEINCRTRLNDDLPECIAIQKSTASVPKVVPTSPSVTQPTTHVKSVETTISSHPPIDESLTRQHDEISLSVGVEKVKTSAAPRIIIVSVATKTPSPPMTPRVPSSIVESDWPMSTEEFIESLDAHDLTSHSTPEQEESTAPSTMQAISSFPGDVTESDSNIFDRNTHSFSDDLMEDHKTSVSETQHQDEETTSPDIRETTTHELLPEKPSKEVEEKVSTSDAQQSTSQRQFQASDSVVSTAGTLPFSKEESEEGEADTQSHSSAVAVSSEDLWTVHFTGSTIHVPIDDVESTFEQSHMPSFSSSFAGERDSVTVPLELYSTESSAKGLRSLIVTQLMIEDNEEDSQATTPPSFIVKKSQSPYDSSTDAPTESSSDETLVLETVKMATLENKTGKARSRSQSVQTTQMPLSNPAQFKSRPTSASYVDSAAMTTADHVSAFLIVVILVAIIVVVVLLAVLGKALNPKCALLRPKPCIEHGAVPYTEQTDQPNQVVLKGITNIDHDNRCTQV